MSHIYHNLLLIVAAAIGVSLMSGMEAAALTFSDDFDRTSSVAGGNLGSDWLDPDSAYGISDGEGFIDNSGTNGASGSGDNAAEVQTDCAACNVEIGEYALVNLVGDVDVSEGFSLSARLNAFGDGFSGLLFAFEQPDDHWQFRVRGRFGDEIFQSSLIQYTTANGGLAGGPALEVGPSGAASVLNLSPTSTVYTTLDLTYDGTNLSATATKQFTGQDVAQTVTSSFPVALNDGSIGMFSRVGAGAIRYDDFTFTGTLVPEPGTIGLLSFGCLTALAVIGRRRRRGDRAVRRAL